MGTVMSEECKKHRIEAPIVAPSVCASCELEKVRSDRHDFAVENERLRAELAALKAGQGEAVAWEYRVFHGDDTVTPGWDRWERVEARYASETVASRVKEIQGYIGQGYRYELRALYTTPAASADAVSVPRELLERWKIDCGPGHPLFDELRALLAQSESER